MRRTVLLAVFALASPGAAAAQGDALLMGAAYDDSDLRPLGPGLTTLTFVPGRGLVRNGAAPLGPPARAAVRREDSQVVRFGLIAPVRLSTRARVLDALGVGDGRDLGREPRWFVFLAASGRALGYNFREDGRALALERGGFVGEAQAGLAYRVGDYQASLSYIRQEIDLPLFGVGDIDEDRGALTFTRFLGDPESPVRGVYAGKSALLPPGE